MFFLDRNTRFCFKSLLRFYARQVVTTCHLQGRLLQTPYKNYKTERMFKIYRLTSYYTHVFIRVGAMASLLRPFSIRYIEIKIRGKVASPPCITGGGISFFCFFPLLFFILFIFPCWNCFTRI